MRNNTTNRAWLFFGVSCIAMATNVAWADPQADQGSAGLEEIVVTARKTKENVQTTPLAMTVFSSSLLKRAQINSVDDLDKIVPSMETKAQPTGGGTTTIAIRGFVDTNPTNLLGDGPVAIYIDGVYLGRDAGDELSLVDLERVEVEAGPQGTLFGRNATGGAISMFSKPPADTFGVEERVSYGSFDDFLTRTTVDTGEIGDTGFYAKLAYMHHDNTGYGVTNTEAPKKSDEPGAVRTNGYFFSLYGNLGPDITLDYRFDWSAGTNQSYAVQTIGMTPTVAAYYGASASLGGQPFPVLGTPGPGGTVEVQPNFMKTVTQRYLGPNVNDAGGHGLTLTWQADDDLSLKSITAYRSLHLVTNTNFGGNANLIGNASPFGGVYAPIDILTTTDNNNNQYQWSEELQVNGKFDRFTYVTGLYYFNEHVGNTSLNSQATFVEPAGACLVFFGNDCVFQSPTTFGAQIGNTVDTAYSGGASSRAGYFNGTYKPPGFDDQLEISGGIRYTWDTKTINQTYSGGFLPTPVHKQVNFYNFSANGTIKYQVTPEVMAYVRGGNAYRAGGFNPNNTNEAFGANSYNPEEALSYEIGVKSDLFDHHMRLNADIYYTDYTNLQVALVGSGSGGFSSFTSNAGHARFIGFEAQASIVLGSGWQFDGSVGLIDPKYLEYFESSAPGAPNLAKTVPLTFSNLPKATLSAAAQYSFDPMPIGDLTLRADWSYRSRSYDSVDPSLGPNVVNGIAQTPGYTPYDLQSSGAPFNDVGVQITLANIPVGLPKLNLEAEFYGKNLLDHHDELLAVDLISGLGFANEAWGPGRSFGVMLVGKY